MFGNALILALREIRRNLMRAILTTLGIVIGVAAVVIIVTIGSGVSQSVSDSISSLGRNLIVLQPGVRRGPGGGGANVGATPFTLDDVEAIQREVPTLRAVAAVATRAATAVAGNANYPTQIAGTENAYMGVRDWPLGEGRAFTEAEERNGRAVCILGQTPKNKLFGAQDPLGLELRVGQIPCQVVGVLSAKGQSSFGQDQDDLILMPLRTVQRRLIGKPDVTNILVSTNQSEEITDAKRRIIDLMRERRLPNPDAEDDFRVDDMVEIANTIQSTTAVLTAFLAAIGAISLIVGGIGIMNVMLMSVTERTREIGIRMAIGARERDVMIQFLTESVMMSGLGGVIGIVLGLGITVALTRFMAVPFVLSPLVVVVAFVFSAGIGIAFGYFPARRAARMDPIEALRHE